MAFFDITGGSTQGPLQAKRLKVGPIEVDDIGDITGVVTINGAPVAAPAFLTGTIPYSGGALVTPTTSRLVSSSVAFTDSTANMPPGYMTTYPTTTVSGFYLQKDDPLAGVLSYVSEGYLEGITIAANNPLGRVNIFQGGGIVLPPDNTTTNAATTEWVQTAITDRVKVFVSPGDLLLVNQNGDQLNISSVMLIAEYLSTTVIRLSGRLIFINYGGPVVPTDELYLQYTSALPPCAGAHSWSGQVDINGSGGGLVIPARELSILATGVNGTNTLRLSTQTQNNPGTAWTSAAALVQMLPPCTISFSSVIRV